MDKLITMKTYINITLTSEVFKSKVADLCPKIAAKFNTVVDVLNEEGNVTGSNSLTFEEFALKFKGVGMAYRPFKWTNLTTEEYQEDIVEFNKETLEMDVIGTETKTRLVPVMRQEQWEDEIHDVEDTHQLYLMRFTDLSDKDGERRELKNLGTNLTYPFNTLLSEQEARELLNSENVTRNA